MGLMNGGRKLVLVLIVSLLFGNMSMFCHEPMAKEEVVSERFIIEQIYQESSLWVDSVMRLMSDNERIAQLFWLAVENPGSAAYKKLLSVVETHQPGGVLLFRMPVETAVNVIEQMQALAEVPLLVSIDGEWGLAMRFPELVTFPHAMTLGAISNDSLIYEMGLEIARQMRIVGIHINMAPVADVNSNPNNPIIGTRSFGEEPDNVARKSVAYMQGLQAGNVMAVGKHFPGHGDTDTDSHKTLPIVNHTIEQLQNTDLVPFTALSDAGIWGLMTAHIEVPALEQEAGVPASFSKSVIENLLREHIGFQGLIITDAMNMQGAKVMGRPGVVDALALAAGNDIVEFTENLPAAIEEVKKAIDNGLLTWDDVNAKCHRSLAFKYWLTKRGFDKVANDSLGVKELINSEHAKRLNQRLYDASLTVLKADTGVFPISKNIQRKYACVVLGDAPELALGLKNEFGIPIYNLPLNDAPSFNRTISSLSGYDSFIVIVANSGWGRLSANSASRNSLVKLVEKEGSISVFMANPYHLTSWKGLVKADGLILTYQNSEQARYSVFKFLKGEIGACGQIPVSVESLFVVGDGIVVEP